MKKSISWFEPRWSYVPKLKRELASVLRLGMWLRVIVMCALVTYLLAGAVHRGFPDLEFDWVGRLLEAIATMVVGLGAFAGFLFLLPPLISVTRRGIARQQGQSVHWRLRADIHALTVDWTEPLRPLLRVEAERPMTIGIGPKIARAELARFLRETFPEVLVKEQLSHAERALP